jgi:hypothetical protein
MSVVGRRFFMPALAAAGVVASLTVSCGGGDSPSSSTPPATVAVVATPPPTPPGISSGFRDSTCSLGRGNPDAACETSRLTQLQNDVETAQDALVQQKPQVFDLQDQFPAGSGAYRIRDREAYLEGLVANLRRTGLCAERDPDDAFQQRIRVKNTNDFSEDFDVILPSGYMRKGNGLYVRTCAPAAFPVDRDAEAPPIGSGCGRPYPPPITRWECKVHVPGPNTVLDSTPKVGPDWVYCAAAGFTDGRSICAVRPHGAPDREACENWRVGKARDTGQPGPTWTRDGAFCTGPASGCERIQGAPYGLLAYEGGTYVVSAENGADCTVEF